MTADASAKAMESLMHVLIDFVDTARVHDQNFEIAQALVAHHDELADLSLRSMADLCFVSRASFSRFCRFMGFDSFSEFKEALDSTNYVLSDDYTKDFRRTLFQDSAMALGSYRQSLVQIINESLSDENLALIPDVLEAMGSAKRTVFFSHHFMWNVGRYFQGKMLQMGPYVELYSAYEHQLEAAESLMEGDVAFICSINGSYFSHYADITKAIYGSGATTIVMTQNRHALNLNRADYVITCGTTNENDIGKYAALMTIDYLVMAYLAKTQAEA